MRKTDGIILAIGAVATLAWIVFSSKDGFRSNNATIVARNINLVATIDGQVENNPPPVGATVNSEDLLARIHDGRFDRGRLIEFESQIAYLSSEIGNLQEQHAALDLLQEEFTQRAKEYSQWMLGDTMLKHREFEAQFEAAKAQKRLEDEEVERARQLYAKQLTSEVEMQIANTQAEIAGAQLELSKASLDRSSLMVQTMESQGVFFDSGDTSYWEKMDDDLSIRQFDNLNSISMLEAQLIQARTQAEAEGTRIDRSFAEEHRAPFKGKVSARFVTQGTRVTSGTRLLQVIDCSHPVVIIPIPDNRISDFSIGLRVSVYPIDSEQKLSGKIEYISSGPMIGSDTSIQIQQEITLQGNRAIVSFDENQILGDSLESCETARIAVVVIHTQSFLDMVAAWL